MIADEVRALPDHLAGRRVEAGGVRGAETNVDASLLDHRRRRRIRVERMTVLRGCHDAEEFLVEDLSGTLGHADRGQLRPVLGRGGEPDTIVPNHRRGPRFAGNRRFPDHVLPLAPPDRQIRRAAVSLVGRAAIAGPILSGSRPHGRRRSSKPPPPWIPRTGSIVFLPMVAYPRSDAIIIETQANGRSPCRAGSGQRCQGILILLPGRPRRKWVVERTCILRELEPRPCWQFLFYSRSISERS